ncbi:MAG: hypothetical protein JGK17_31390 [Microcoleus sp. PH2017_10_PVI_O_A]|uniref:hypothetical protein n=1 Tax=unclassified Microcoleus TaxID=2642155 RepID=UPI001D815618|nr:MULTISPECIES: hypothetical protein [unclassified Microcoleus]TAE73385.1 MAG: hypothetical protein EAZ83_31480 [Oscillatoriales cyanobacterium]MCC3409961.1 hypothetical protein [Microcoleus sp. PH2017_10_PVI_O_A]MCC3464223.1 hypothetical protein [Microcoleus sp. PH2017_11_PCY_U_A]MCC3482566.1 hypothetical protein [Microcoleus sp. PH2017_12_PCY_D_A]MCC3526787.1 hypothetical protein [Microcoleus sp. PH2017_21_RUC_O_A]
MNSTPSPQNFLHRIRKQLGFAKYVLLDGGHREVRYKWRLDSLNRWAGNLLDKLSSEGVLSPIETPVASDVELHMLCGHSNVTMGIWSLWSLLRWADGKMTPVIQSDGSITPEDVLRFRKFFPHVRFLFPEDAKRLVEQRLAGSEFEFLRSFSHTHFFGSRLLASHMSEQARVVVGIDSDVLVFDRPTEVLEQCAVAHNSPALTSFRDEFDWVTVCAPVNEIEARCGTRIECSFNGGLVVLPKFGDEQFSFMERMLRAYTPEWRAHYFAEQMLLALTAGEFGWNELPVSYQMGQETNSPDAIAIHYISNHAVRPRYFSEGVARLVGQQR